MTLNKIARTYSIRYSLDKAPVPRITPKDLHWLCRGGEKPIIIDARPKAEHDLFHIMGTVNIPLETFKDEDISDIPRDRPVFVCGATESEDLAVGLAEKLRALPHPRVSVVLGGPDVIRAGGFLYYKDVVKYDKLIEEKKLAAAKAPKA